MGKAERRSRLHIRKRFQKKFIGLIVSSMIIVVSLAMAAVYTALRFQMNESGFSAYTTAEAVRSDRLA